ncbi:hypothetical protein M0R45_011335 [Rubus argutus]|uniref:Peroxidase n=1 Tax=Rubus argutus TaxID=59490 RepID=A0AAW1YCC5_RUBAR
MAHLHSLPLYHSQQLHNSPTLTFTLLQLQPWPPPSAFGVRPPLPLLAASSPPPGLLSLCLLFSFHSEMPRRLSAHLPPLPQPQRLAAGLFLQPGVQWPPPRLRSAWLPIRAAQACERKDSRSSSRPKFCHPLLVRWDGMILTSILVVTYADLFQLASASAVEVGAGGPKIPMKYGRVDVSAPEQCPEEGRLPDAGPPSPADHLREVFYRMGLNDKEIVALSGAHTLGRSRPERSGWGKPETKYTKDGPGAPGGQSWTAQWLKFDNSYFKDIKEKRDEDLLVLPTDAALFEDPSFKVFAEKYADDQEAFFNDYAEAHAKLSNLGAKFDPPEGIVIDDGPSQPVPEKFVAAKYSSGKRELSDSMKQKIRAEYQAIGGSPDKPLQSNYFLNIIIVIAVLAILTSLFGN